MADRTFESQQLASQRHAQAGAAMSSAAANFGQAVQKRAQEQREELDTLTEQNKQRQMEAQRLAAQQAQAAAENNLRQQQINLQAKEQESQAVARGVELEQRGTNQQFDQTMAVRQQAERERSNIATETQNDYELGLRRDQFSLGKARFQQEAALHEYERQTAQFRMEKMQRESQEWRLRAEDEQLRYGVEAQAAETDRLKTQAQMERLQLQEFMQSQEASRVSAGTDEERRNWLLRQETQNLFGGEEGARQAVEQQRREGLVKTITTMAQMHGRNEFDSMAVRMSNDAFKIAFDLQRGAITPERASDLMSGLGAVRDSESRKVQERLTPETAADLLSSMPARARELHDGMTFPAPVGIKAKIGTWLAENPVAKRRMEMRGRQAHAAESERASKDGRGKLPDTSTEEAVKIGQDAILRSLNLNQPGAFALLSDAYGGPLTQQEIQELLAAMQAEGLVNNGEFRGPISDEGN